MYQFLVTIFIIIPFALSSPVEYGPRSFMDVVKGIQNRSPTNGNCVAKCPWFQIYKFLPHDDCNKYCVCISRFQFAVECQEGTYFSAKHDTCVDPIESECGKVEGCLGQCPHESLNAHVLLPHDDCNKYCHCRKGRPIPENCAPNYQFNADRQQCLPLEQAECNRLNGFTTSTTASPTTTSVSSSETYPPTTSSSLPSTSSSSTSESSSTTTTTYPPASSPSSTTSPSSTSESSSTTTNPPASSPSSTTSPSTIFNPSSTTKTFTTSSPLPTTTSKASTTESVKTTSIPTTTTEKRSSPNSSPEPTTLRAVKTPSDRSVANCAGHCPRSDDPDSVVLLAHKDCTKYCRCREGRPLIKNCPPHYHFSLDQEMCLPTNYTTCHHLAHH